MRRDCLRSTAALAPDGEGPTGLGGDNLARPPVAERVGKGHRLVSVGIAHGSVPNADHQSSLTRNETIPKLGQPYDLTSVFVLELISAGSETGAKFGKAEVTASAFFFAGQLASEVVSRPRPDGAGRLLPLIWAAKMGVYVPRSCGQTELLRVITSLLATTGCVSKSWRPLHMGFRKNSVNGLFDQLREFSGK